MRTLFFVSFLTLIMRYDPYNQAFSVSWLPVNADTLELAVLRNTNLSFACCSQKLNYVKNDFLIIKPNLRDFPRVTSYDLKK